MARRGLMGAGLLGLGLLAAPALAADPDGTIVARQGAIEIEATEAARWKALVGELRRQREAAENERTDLRALLEKALVTLEQRTKERDEWQLKAAPASRTPKADRDAHVPAIP